MQAFTIVNFLQSAAQVAQVAQKVRESVASAESDPYAQFVKYEGVVDHPTNFYVDVLHVRFIARFEYVKHTNQGRQFTSGQYAFFEKHGQDEKRAEYAVRFLAPNIVLTGGGEVIELPFMNDDGGHEVSRVRAAIARNLLGYVIDNLETWSF
jgi:hypothetical protein